MLTQVSVQYRPATFVASLIFPVIPVDHQTDKYFKFTKDNFRSQDDTKRPGSLAHEAEFQLIKDDYNADGHALKFRIPDPWRKNSTGGVDLDIDTTVELTDKILLNQDVNLFNLISAQMAPVDLAAARWDDPAIDPILRLDAEKAALGKKLGGKIPNVLVLPRLAFTGVRNNPKVASRITGAQNLRNSTITAQQLADVLELDQVIVADVVKNKAAEGQADDMDYVWGKTALLLYRPPLPGLRTISLGYHFVWLFGKEGQTVRRYRDEDRESDVIEVQKYYDQKLVCPEAGTFFTNVIA